MKIKAFSPARISLAGGGTDLDSFFVKHGGITISMAINVYERVTLLTKDDMFANLTSMPYDISPKYAYSILKDHGIGSMHLASVQTQFDGVIGAGLGSSGAFGVALIAAIHKMLGKQTTAIKLALEAWQAENKMWTTGMQDHYISALGGMQIITYGQRTQIVPVERQTAEYVKEYVHLFYTGGRRLSGHIQKNFRMLTPQQEEVLLEIKNIALLMSQALIAGKMDLVGKYLHASWETKKKLGISNPKIDGLYTYARKHGAMGGKLMGAGQSGYMFFFVPPERSKKFVDKMGKMGLEETDFSIDYNGVMTKIL